MLASTLIPPQDAYSGLMVTTELLEAIRGRLRAAADSGRAAGAPAYMKSQLPFLGVRVPEVRRMVEAAAVDHPPAGLADLQDTVLVLWRNAVCREERCAAIELTGLKVAAVLEANLDDPEFFIRKAIGWALRQYARTDPEWVRAFVQRHRDQLSPLSRREALRSLSA